MLEWCGRARGDLQDNLRGSGVLVMVVVVVVGPFVVSGSSSTGCTGAKSLVGDIHAVLPREGGARRAGRVEGRRRPGRSGRLLVIVRRRYYAQLTEWQRISSTVAARRRSWWRVAARHRRGDRRRCGQGSRGARGRGTRRRRMVRIGLRLDDHLRGFSGVGLVVRDDERRVLLLRDAHVVARVGLLHDMSGTWWMGNEGCGFLETQ